MYILVLLVGSVSWTCLQNCWTFFDLFLFFRPKVLSTTCAEHFCQIGPNGLEIDKETTHDLV